MGAPLPKKKRLAGLATDISLDCFAGADLELHNLEDTYCQIVPRSHRKRYGQFFTPRSTARLMAEWVSGARPRRVLDPAVGTGVLLRAVQEQAPAAALVGYDIDPRCLEMAALHLPRAAKLVEADYLTAKEEDWYDGIIANPPYLRHHDLIYDFDIHQRFSSAHRLKISKLANAYILFTLKALSRLTERGRAAILIPAEWSNANFGDSLKRYFLDSNSLAQVVYFSHQGLVFDDNYSTGCVLLIENGHKGDCVETHYIDHEETIASLDDLASNQNIQHFRFKMRELAAAKKWDHLLANGHQETVKGLVPLRALAKTKRGIATGANEYFHLNEARAREAGLSVDHLEPCIGKARHVASYAFKEADLVRLRREGREVFLIDFKRSLTAADRRYIEEGEAQGINERYLTKTRSPWFSMERQEPAPIWAAVFGRSEMRFIVNEAGIKNLTTFHCVYPHDARPVFVKALAACLNSKSIQARARSKNRVYGGGLLKYEPKDLLEVEVPDLSKVSADRLTKLAAFFDEAERAVRAGGEGFTAPGLEEAVEAAIAEVAPSFLL